MQFIGLRIQTKYCQPSAIRVCLRNLPLVAAAGVLMLIRSHSLHSLKPVQRTAFVDVRTYHPSCKWSFQKGNEGYAPVANDGREDLIEFVCPSMFRDLSDYVYQWPYEHFGERDVWVADLVLAAQNLPPVPIIYSQSNGACDGSLYHDFLVPWVRKPYILITGQSDLGIPSECQHANNILGDTYLIKWFAQNNDSPHPNITPIPIGLNCFEHASEMQTALRALAQTERISPADGVSLLVNFGHTHSDRAGVWAQLCGQNHTFVKCLPKTWSNNITSNPGLVGMYEDMTAYQYIASPRGNGLDCHRFWEALYLGVIPVVEHSPLDALYLQAENVLFVNSFADVTEELLRSNLRRLEHLAPYVGKRSPPVLTRKHWKELIEGVRANTIASLGLEDVNPRKRCWGRT